MSMSVRFGTNVIDKINPRGPVRLWDCGVEWARLEPNRGQFDWSKLDNLVNQLAGRDITLVLGHPPLWATDGADGKQASWMTPGSNRPPVSDEDWSIYIVTTVNRYRGKIKNYQIWNEPVDKRFYSGNYQDLAQLTYRAKRLINITDPNALVLSPPLQPRKQAKWDTQGKSLYLALKDKGFPFHVWTGHVYPQIGEGTSGWVRDVRMIQNRIDEGLKPLWITETNFNLGGPNNPWPLDKQRQTLDTIRSRCYTLGIPRIYWYGAGHPDPTLFAIVQQ